MAQTSTMTTASPINLSPEHLGLGRLASTPNPVGSLEVANKALQKNHETHHMFFRDQGGHNHIAHSVLSVLALGGGPTDLQRAYDDGVDIVKQRLLPPLDLAVVEQMGDPAQFRARIGQLPQYTNFLAFFKNQMKSKGWRDVVAEYLFSGTPLAETMLAHLYEGAYHPLIHLGLGVEFELPSIVAEGLAQAAAHDSANLEAFFAACEKKEAKVGKPLVQVLGKVRANDKLRTASRVQDGPVRVRDGVLGRAFDEIVAVASQFRVHTDTLERGAAESINVSAYMAGAAQRPGKARKIDFFHMHNVTSSIFLSVLLRQPWIKPEDKVRLVERKGRLDLVWHAASGAPELRLEDVVGYEAVKSKGMGWEQIYELVRGAHDDGHVAKFVRALKNGEEVSKPYEAGEGSGAFPIKGDTWLRIAQMACDTTLSTEDHDARWIMGCFDPLWARIPDM